MSEMKKKCIKLAVGFSFDQNHPVLYENYMAQNVKKRIGGSLQLLNFIFLIFIL
jgi:hypothetical protein